MSKNAVVRLTGLLLASLSLAACSSGLEAPLPTLNTQATSTTLTIPLVSATDDAEEKLGGGMELTGGLLDFRAKDGVLQTVGVRFQNVAIPQGAKIASAYFTVKGGVADTGSVTLKVSGEATDNALTFTSSKNNISSRAKTTASVLWPPNSWVAGGSYKSGNIAAVVQEVVSRSGWQSGNALSLMIEGVSGTAERSAIAFGGAASNVPALVVTFSGGTTPTPPTPTEPTPTPTEPVPTPTEPTPTPTDPTPTPTPTEPTPGNPSAEQALWLNRLKKTISSPKYDQYNGWMNPLTQASSGNIFIYGRMMNFYVTSLILAYRETGDRSLMVQLETVMNIAKGTLADTNGDGYRNWLEKHKDSSAPELYMTDDAAMDEMLTHSMVASAAYALKQAGFSSSADFWTDYLKNDFEAKWRKRKNKPTGFPFLHHFLMHPTAQFVRYHYYMYKLTGDASYLGEAKRLAGVVNSTIRADGTWAHVAGQTSGCQPAVYTIITGQAFADLATNGSGLVSDGTMKLMAGAMARNVVKSVDGTSLGGSICGNSTYGGGNVYYFVSYPYSQLARWDDSGKLRLATERTYATTEKFRMESPRIYNLPAMMVFALGK